MPSYHRWAVGVIGVASVCVGAFGYVMYARAAAPPGQFEVEGLVAHDTQTGLTWQVTPSASTMTWEAANTYCASLVLDRYDDWRLPTVLELQSIIDGGSVGPVLLDSAFFDGGASKTYWSKTKDRGLPNYIVVDVEHGLSISQAAAQANSQVVRCVRSP